MEAVEEPDGLLGGGLMAMDGQSRIDDLLHLATDGPCIVEGDRPPDVEIHIIAIGNGDVDGHLTGIEEVMDRLAEHKEKGAGIGSGAAGRGDVEELHLLLLVNAEVHSLHLIIYVSGDGAVLHLQSRLLIDIHQI